MSNIYGDWLRERREAAGLTQQQLADRAVMTRSHIAHIEAGRRVPSKGDAQRLDKALGTGNVLSSFLPQEDVAVADYFEAALELEKQAVVIRESAVMFVPGLLQTKRYARSVLGTTFPPLRDEERDRRLVTRLERAKLLDDPVTPTFWALLDEGLLHRVVGDKGVMAEQLVHLVDLMESGRIRVHVMPRGTGAYPVMQGMLSLMWFEDQPPVAYSEGIRVAQVHDSPAVVEQLQGAYYLALSDALPLRESLALLKATAKDYDHDA
ncbi:Scr1 family TA system antitoxin-like transcriptional regulator [Streptomyces sp. TRM68367]|uniref:helix-turn-helix domain-containing protein n=1 Tax=Streptomyces sp. TRM68367 TaxID=2758415 RepID=UPI00165BAE20|nr:Scr1 family TA system antitoxin-like transcriptional regulator [Streptomyces sp. TRM68367]MBC9726736.1 helix-turn-helix transcriptional regulator [Streptomyces sp. TRM68367]